MLQDGTTEAVEPTATTPRFAAEMAPESHSSYMGIAVGVMAVIAIVAALYLARAFFVPLLIGIIANYTLSPVVGWLKACHVPRPVGAALVLIILTGGLTWIAFSLSDDAAAMIAKLPEATRKLRQNLNDTHGSPTTLQNVQEAAKQLEGAASDAGEKPKVATAPVPAKKPDSWILNYVAAQSSLLFEVIGQALIVLLLTYFLLASGTHFRRKLVQFVGPSLSRKHDTVLILDEIDVQIQRYLLTMLVSNSLVGVCTWIAFAALGIEHAAVWGVVTGVVQFIPYLGPALIAVASGVAGFLQFGSLLQALGVAGVTLVIAGAIGFMFTTWMQSRFAHMNAAVLFIALLFFGWLWGVWGLLLGAPLVAIAKVICDRIDTLKPIGELLGK